MSECGHGELEKKGAGRDRYPRVEFVCKFKLFGTLQPKNSSIGTGRRSIMKGW